MVQIKLTTHVLPKWPLFRVTCHDVADLRLRIIIICSCYLKKLLSFSRRCYHIHQVWHHSFVIKGKRWWHNRVKLLLGWGKWHQDLKTTFVKSICGWNELLGCVGDDAVLPPDPMSRAPSTQFFMHHNVKTGPGAKLRPSCSISPC